MSVDILSRIPDSLKAFDSWICCDLDDRKFPQHPGEHTPASGWSHNPHSFAECAADVEAGVHDSVGFIFQRGLNIIGFDLDHVIYDTGMSDWARWVISLLGSYAEVSPSGDGVHILCVGELPDKPTICNVRGWELPRMGPDLNGVCCHRCDMPKLGGCTAKCDFKGAEAIEGYTDAKFVRLTGKRISIDGKLMSELVRPDPAILRGVWEMFFEYPPSGMRNVPSKKDEVLDAIERSFEPERYENVGDEAVSALKAIPVPTDYKDWVEVSMAANEKGISYEEWDAWCRQDMSHYNERENLTIWNHFKAEGNANGVITRRTLFHIAYEAGWKPPRPSEEDWSELWK